MVDPIQNRIYAVYELTYDLNSRKTRASAIFNLDSEKSKARKISDVSEIKFSNETIPFNTADTVYSREYSNLVSAGTFAYRDSVKNVFSNPVTMLPKIDVPVIDTIYRSSGSFEFKWIGDSVTSGTKVTLRVSNISDPSKKLEYIQQSLQANNIVLGVNELFTLPAGPALFHTERYSEQKAKSATPAGAKIISRYIGRDRIVYIK